MQKILCVAILSVLVLGELPALAVEGSEVQLRSSSVAGTKAGVVGQFDITVPDKMVFRALGSPDLAMPYANIVEFSSREEVTHHLGLIATIVVGLLKPRMKQHYITISYRDSSGVMQVAAFEVAKRTPDILISLLQARARNACQRAEYGACTPVVSQPRKLLPPSVSSPAPQAL
ncbi:MAG TPA: hypothetical protein VFC39_02720 [Acidobacteriaceae bacterium]|nr:hypothetical protein [Acidobacteriaceae bacterium]